jgi:hypothetical protein
MVGLKKIFFRPNKWIAAFFLVMAIDFFSQIISGKGIQHYLLITIPSSVVLIAMLIQNNISEYLLQFPKKRKIFQIFFLSILIFSTFRIADDLTNFSIHSIINENRQEQIEYLLSDNKPAEKIIINSSNAWLYLQANRKSASKYFTDIALTNNFLNTRAEYISLINLLKPQIIITRSCNDNEKCYPEIKDILKQYYKKDVVIDDMEFWQLN